jgi:hypothetical protein
MNLIKIKLQEDYGHDLYVTLFQVKNWCIMQSCFSKMVYGRVCPYFNLTLGSGRLVAISFQIWYVGFTVELISRAWFEQ